MLKRQKGFTLVELAIALVVIGLLLGGLLKGQELIENGKVTAAVRMMNEYKTAALAFRSSYGEYPGDMVNPAQRLSDCEIPICALSGNRDDKVNAPYGPTNKSEVYNFAVHLSKSGYMDGPSGGTQVMFDADADSDRAAFFALLPLARSATGRLPYLFLEYFETHAGTPPAGVLPFLPAHYYTFATQGKHSFLLDSKMDDGFPFTGDVRVDEYNDCADAPGGVFTATSVYNMIGSECRLKVLAGF